MGYLLLGIIAIGLAVLAGYAFVRADTAALARILRLGLGYSALALAGLLAVTGRFLFAIPLAWLGMMLLGRRMALPAGFPGTGRPSAGKVSRVRTATLEMTLDHDTGAMDGEVLAGARAGTRLGALGLEALMALRRECAASDPRAMQLIEAYLDRMHQGWRPAAGAEGAESAGRGPADSGGPMTREEAYEILGIRPGASRDDIRHAHRQLMKRLHPDQGGSTYLASKVNEAKDLLLRA